MFVYGVFGRQACQNLRAGYTLIELLVVVLIIGVLAAVALPQYRVAVTKARYAQLITAGTALQQAERRYYLANGEYTADMRSLDVSLPGCVLNESGRGCSSAQYSCYVNDGTTDSHAQPVIYPYCAMGGQPNFLAFYLHLNGMRTCYAAQSKPVNNAVCKSFGGALIGTVGSAYNQYSMP